MARWRILLCSWVDQTGRLATVACVRPNCFPRFCRKPVVGHKLSACSAIAFLLGTGLFFVVALKHGGTPCQLFIVDSMLRPVSSARTFRRDRPLKQRGLSVAKRRTRLTSSTIDDLAAGTRTGYAGDSLCQKAAAGAVDISAVASAAAGAVAAATAVFARHQE